MDRTRTLPRRTAGALGVAALLALVAGLPTGAAQAEPSTASDVAVQLDAGPKSTLLSEVTYTVTTTNRGPDALTAGAVTAMLPEGLEFTGSTSCLYEPTTRAVNCPLAGLAPNTQRIDTFRAQVKLSDPSVNSITVVAAPTGVNPVDQVSTNDFASATCEALTTTLVRC